MPPLTWPETGDTTTFSKGMPGVACDSPRVAIGRIISYHDNVDVTFKKGKNQLVLKVLNYNGPWGFSCQWLDL